MIFMNCPWSSNSNKMDFFFVSCRMNHSVEIYIVLFLLCELPASNDQEQLRLESVAGVFEAMDCRFFSALYINVTDAIAVLVGVRHIQRC